MENVFLFTIIGLAIGFIIVLIADDLERTTKARNRGASTNLNLKNQLAHDLILKQHTALKSTDPVKRAAQEWIYEYAVNEASQTLKGLEPLVKKIQVYYKEELQATSKFVTDFPVKQDLILAPLESFSILTILEEGLHNAARFSKANFVFAITSLVDDALIIIVHDNGVGFEQKIMEIKNGFATIQHAANNLNAHLKITSTQGNGTVVNVSKALKNRKVIALKKQLI